MVSKMTERAVNNAIAKKAYRNIKGEALAKKESDPQKGEKKITLPSAANTLRSIALISIWVLWSARRRSQTSPTL